MKYCYKCGRMTPGEPLFCNFCGCTYDIKLCPRLHVNSRNAEVCSQCGSRDFTTPQPKVSLSARLLVFSGTFLLGVALLVFTVLFAALFISDVFTTTEMLNDLVVIGIMLAVLWWMWMQVPGWFRKSIHKLLQRKRSQRN